LGVRSPQNLDEAVDEVGRWADSLPGDFAVEVTGFDDARVIQVRICDIAAALEVTITERLSLRGPDAA
jgi:hypothetical protein